MPQPSIIRTPKSYWRDKRRNSHSDWRFASMRELFQNSIDAGATRINVSLTEEDGKGSWDRAPNNQRVIRIVFTDNGSGITREVLQNVFFSPGESTKRDSASNVGGFGTARTMLCFSQSRYAVRTGSLAVEGDGSEYTIDDAPTNVRGTEFEIDISPMEDGERNTIEDMREALMDYLKYSQLTAKVTVNGEEIKTGTKRGQLARRLVANISGRETEFAGVHVSRNEKSAHRGKVVVRVQGTTMFVRNADVPFGVIVEIDPSMARTVLTDSRDSMKWNYENALNSFIAELNRDVRSALDKEEKRKHTIVRGGLGEMRQLAVQKLKNISWKPDAALVAKRSETVPASALRYISPEEFEVTGYGGVSALPMEVFVDRIKEGEATFLNTWANADEVREFTTNVRNEGTQALGRVDGAFGSYIAAGVALSAQEAGVDERYADMHDVHIYKEGISPEDNKELFSAVRRWSPAFWRKENDRLAGRGIGPHMTLSAWTVCCRHAVNYLATIRPDIVPEGGLQFATGFAFIKDEDVWNYTLGKSVKQRTAALHRQLADTHVLLLNPLLSNGESAYNLKKEGGVPGEGMGLADMFADVAHEVAHILRTPHDEEYAAILTQMMTAFMNQTFQKTLRADIRENIDAVRAAYGRGKSRIQTLDVESLEAVDSDDEKMPRPAERLRALSSPATTLIVGSVTSPDNIEAAEQETPALLEYIHLMTEREAACVIEVNCDAAAVLESIVSETFRETHTPEVVSISENDINIAATPVEVKIDVSPDVVPDMVKSEITEIVNIQPAVETPQPEASSPISLSSLDIGNTPKTRIRDNIKDSPQPLEAANILATLGSTGRFAAPKKLPANEGSVSPTLINRQRIEAGIAGEVTAPNPLFALIGSGRLKGLSERIKKSVGNLSELPVAVEAASDETVADAIQHSESVQNVPVVENIVTQTDLVGEDFNMDDDDDEDKNGMNP